MKKADIAVLGTVLAAAGIIALLLFCFGQNGEYVQIEINSKVQEVLPLNEDAVKVIETENGTNTVVIEDGIVRVSEADCPDKICVHHSGISKSGESIICLPHRLVVSVINEKEKESVDAVIQ